LGTDGFTGILATYPVKIVGTQATVLGSGFAACLAARIPDMAAR
jgi:hypothetical protein